MKLEYLYPELGNLFGEGGLDLSSLLNKALAFLEQKGIYVSSGSACSKGKKSSVLSEFGVPDKLADFTIRISFCA